MHLFTVAAAALTIPVASAQLNKLAQKAGKLYFGTATDTGELSNTTYFDILTNTKEFGQLTPSNGQKVSRPLYLTSCKTLLPYCHQLVKPC
jgi:endo-1,4-beta-xylanase